MPREAHGSLAGGFTKDASEEARTQEKRRIALVDLDHLVDLWIEHYAKLNEPARRPRAPAADLVPRTSVMMNRRRRTVKAVTLGGILLAMLLCSQVAFSQPEAGDMELNLAGSLDVVHHEGIDAQTSGIFSLALARFIMRDLSVGASLGLVAPDSEPGRLSYSALCTAYLPVSDRRVAMPYLGMQIGSSMNEWENETPIIYGGFLGCKVFLSKHSAMSVQPYYLREHGSLDRKWYDPRGRGRDSYDIDRYGVMTGISIFL